MVCLTQQERMARYAGNKRFLPSSCTVHDKVRTSTGDLGSTMAAGPTLATYDCRRGKGKTVQQSVQGVLLDVVRWPLTLAPGAAVSMEQLIVLDGETFEVVVTLDNDLQVTPKVWIQRF